MHLPPRIIVYAALALGGCGSLATIAASSPANRLDALNQLYAATVTHETAYAENCKAAPVGGCAQIVAKAQSADRLAYGALAQANDAYARNDNTDIALLIGVAEGAVKILGTYFTS